MKRTTDEQLNRFDEHKQHEETQREREKRFNEWAERTGKKCVFFDECMTAKDAAYILGVTDRTLRNWAKQKIIERPANNRYLFRDIANYVFRRVFRPYVSEEVTLYWDTSELFNTKGKRKIENVPLIHCKNSTTSKEFCKRLQAVCKLIEAITEDRIKNNGTVRNRYEYGGVVAKYFESAEGEYKETLQPDFAEELAPTEDHNKDADEEEFYNSSPVFLDGDAPEAPDDYENFCRNNPELMEAMEKDYEDYMLHCNPPEDWEIPIKIPDLQGFIFRLSYKEPKKKQTKQDTKTDETE